MKVKALLVFLFLINFQYFYSQKTILWKLEHNGSNKVSYVLGTLHQTGNSFVDERPQIKDLLLHADVAVFESIDDNKKTIIDVINSRPENFSYREYLNKEDVQYLENISKDWTVPLSKLYPAELVVKLEQLYVLNVCETAKPGDTWNHLDDYLISLAKSGNIKSEGLETSNDQFTAINAQKQLDIWPKAQNIIAVRIENLRTKKNKSDICRISQTYLGNMNFDYQFNTKCAPNDPMVSSRNKTWLPKISELLQNSNAFIAVGLTHLFGDCGIISELRKLGYTITPVSLVKK